jgi:hypothetical protein
MKTKFPYDGKIDFGKYLDEYLKREDAVRRIPTEEELRDLARKSIVKEQVTLVPLAGDVPAQEGDTAVLRTESELPRFNKERVTVSLGRGLYSRELETALIGKKLGNTVELVIQDHPVRASILELKRRQIPEPTDEMVLQIHVKDAKGNELRTVADYEAYIRDTKTMEALAAINFHVVERILADYPISDYDEEDIRVLGELEAESFIRMFREQDGTDLTKEVPRGWEEEMNIHSLAEFISKRRDWYQVKIQQCLVFLNILGLPCEGKTDPLDHYEVLTELQEQIFDLIRRELERRNAS